MFWHYFEVVRSYTYRQVEVECYNVPRTCNIQLVTDVCNMVVNCKHCLNKVTLVMWRFQGSSL